MKYEDVYINDYGDGLSADRRSGRRCNCVTTAIKEPKPGLNHEWKVTRDGQVLEQGLKTEHLRR